MRYLTFSDQPQDAYPICFLVPEIMGGSVKQEYLQPFGIDPGEVVLLTLHFSREKKKTPLPEMREFLKTDLVPTLNDSGVKYVCVTDGEYFKELTGANKVDSNLGYVLDSRYGDFKVLYVPSYKTIFRDPGKVRASIAQAMQALLAHRRDAYYAPGEGVIQFEAYPQTDAEIEDWLIKLLEMGKPLSVDIETFSLKHHKAGIGTITFCWSKHEGIAFPVDYVSEPWLDAKGVRHVGKQGFNLHRRKMLTAFFKQFTERALYHNISYDVYVLIYQLFMKDILDTDGLLTGMNVLLRNWDCTKLISYLATNTCAGNELSLKAQAQEFAGNYAMGEDIKDITLIPLDKLLRYNLIDGLSTWHVYEKHWPSLVRDEQLQFYDTIFRPAVLDIVQMQLTGLPVNMRKVKIVKYLLERDERKARQSLQKSAIAQEFTLRLKQEWIDKKNQEWKKKRGTIDDVPKDEGNFNPNSGPQLQVILYEILGLPVIDYTDTRQPATGNKTLEKLLNHATTPDVKAFIQALLDYSAVVKILGDFIPSFLAAIPGPDGWHYLCGNFNLGGTLSGRLSSSDPNLQNLPANSKYAKWIKWCVEAPPGWIFCGLDFASLEDRISALTTKDPNKIKVYTDGYDGHSLRAYAYYKELMADIDPNSVASINSIQEKYKKLRTKSKNPTFTLTYQGTANTLVTKYAFTLELAKQVEARYHELYKVSDDWVAAKLQQAAIDGYVTVAFGLRVRTPLLCQVIQGNKYTPSEAAAEGRSAGNALGQSWCLLNNRAASEFMGKVRASNHRTDIRPCAQIHDAQYYLVRDDIDALVFTNEHLVKAVYWQDHPDIAHPQVGLGGELSIFWPTWRDEIGIPNGADEAQIASIIETAAAKKKGA